MCQWNIVAWLRTLFPYTVFINTYICVGVYRKAGYTLIAKYVKMDAKNEKFMAVYFMSLFFFAFHAPFFAFHISCHDRHSQEKSKNFVVYFFTALIKLEIRMK